MAVTRSVPELPTCATARQSSLTPPMTGSLSRSALSPVVSAPPASTFAKPAGRW